MRAGEGLQQTDPPESQGSHRKCERPAGQARLEAVLSQPTRSQRPTIQDALRLLAVWAVRAARGRTGATDST